MTRKTVRNPFSPIQYKNPQFELDKIKWWKIKERRDFKKKLKSDIEKWDEELSEKIKKNPQYQNFRKALYIIPSSKERVVVWLWVLCCYTMRMTNPSLREYYRGSSVRMFLNMQKLFDFPNLNEVDVFEHLFIDRNELHSEFIGKYPMRDFVFRYLSNEERTFIFEGVSERSAVQKECWDDVVKSLNDLLIAYSWE